MGKTTNIEWTDSSWNPWRGCHKVSQGCRSGYMFRDQVKWARKTPLRQLRVFTCSWSDWFIEEADAWRDEAWDIIRKTPNFTYQILTKRADGIHNCLPD